MKRLLDRTSADVMFEPHSNYDINRAHITPLFADEDQRPEKQCDFPTETVSDWITTKPRSSECSPQKFHRNCYRNWKQEQSWGPRQSVKIFSRKWDLNWVLKGQWEGDRRAFQRSDMDRECAAVHRWYRAGCGPFKESNVGKTWKLFCLAEFFFKKNVLLFKYKSLFKPIPTTSTQNVHQIV